MSYFDTEPELYPIVPFIVDVSGHPRTGLESDLPLSSREVMLINDCIDLPIQLPNEELEPDELEKAAFDQLDEIDPYTGSLKQY